jgi:16S rRNA (uracil1498-N3)-methyltransferase
MKLQRFIGDFNLNEKILAINDAGFYNQLKNVLRLEVGDKLILCDGKNHEAQAQIDSILKNNIKLKIGDVSLGGNEPKIKVTLYCAILKRENFELVVQKATEVGIKRIVPIITERTVKLALNVERLKIISKEAAEQSGRGIIPEISVPMSFKDACKDADANDSNYFFDVSGKSLSSLPKLPNSVGIFIGPEGGWSNGEIEFSSSNKFNSITLGRLTLRAETAAIISSFIAVSGY